MKKGRISYRKSGKSEKMRIWALGGLGAICILNFNKRLAQKLRRIILLHFGHATFRMHFRKTRKPFICIVFGPGGRDRGPQHQLFLALETPGYSKQFKNKSRIIS